MRFLLGELRTETNSFNPFLSSMDFWEKSGIHEGQAVRDNLGGKQNAVAGILAALDEFPGEHETVCGITMTCQCGGPTDQQVMDFFLRRFLNSIWQSLPLDGVFISLHGAMQTTLYDDPEGELLERVRSMVGDKCVIAVSTDLHAFVSRKMMRNTDIITVYHTYPHMDYFDTGYRAGKLGLACLDREHKPKMACATVPIVVSAAAYNTLGGPFRDLMAYGQSLVDKGDVLDFGIFNVTPWLDFNPLYSSVTTIARDYETAERFAKDLAERFYGIRQSFTCKLYAVDEVVAIAEANTSGKPVILQDSADSCNAGAAGDSMAAVARILELGKSRLKTAIVVNDPAAADKAHQLGVGAVSIFRLGGTRDPSSVSVEVEGYVKSLHDGVFVQEGPSARGQINRLGPTAVIRVGNIDIVVCHWMTGNGDPQLFRAFGIEPTLYQLLVVKACTSYRAAYGAFTDLFYETNTPGSATSDLTLLDYKKFPKDCFPWLDTRYNATEFMHGRE